jgi:hypothetical protein
MSTETLCRGEGACLIEVQQKDIIDVMNIKIDVKAKQSLFL